MRIPTSIMIMCLLLFAGISKTLYSTTFTSAQSGYFSAPSTWEGGTVPGPGDDIVIATGHTVTLDASVTVFNITIHPGATLDNGAYNLIINKATPGNPIYSNNGTHNGTGFLVAYSDYKTEISGSGISNCTIEILSYGLYLQNTCNLTINGNIQHASPGNIGMNGKILIEAWQIGASLTINGNIITNPVYGGVGIENIGASIVVNGNVSLPGSSDSGAGSVLTNGAGATFNISGNLTLGPYSSYCQNSGSMIIGGNLTGAYDTYFIQEINSSVKFGGSVFPDGDGYLFAVESPLGGSSQPNTIEYNGVLAQSIALPADGSYSNLVVNNLSDSGVSINTDISLNGNLVLSNGLLTLGAFNLILAGNTTIEGTPSSANMIVATGTGELRKVFTTPGSFTFPVGDNNGLAEYTPVTLNLTAGTYTDAYIGVNLVNESYPGVTGSYLNRYWNIYSTGITDYTCYAQFDYVPADVTGNENDLFCYRVTPTSNQFNQTNTATHQLSANGIFAFGSFTGIQQPNANKTLTLNNVFLQGLYDSGGIMRQAYGENGPNFEAGVADEITIELHSDTEYGLILQSFNFVKLGIEGNAFIDLPADISGIYYITIKHRNSLETVSSIPVDFEWSTVSYSFGNPTQVFGGNLLQTSDDVFVIFGGDITQDGVIDTGDMTSLDNEGNNFATGYIITDVNGDGLVDTGDMTIVDNNAIDFASAIIP